MTSNPTSPQSPATNASTKFSFGQWLYGKSLPLEHETSLFILVNVLDIAMTFKLLERGPFFEANPLARFIIANWYYPGMVFFKMGMVLFVCLVAQIVARTRLELARSVLQLGIGLVSVVVIYSFGLYLLNH